MSEIPRSARLFVAATVAVAISATAIATFRSPFLWDTSAWLDTLLLSLVFVLCASLKTQSANGVNVSVGFVAGMATVVLLGAAAGALVGLSA
ncbi:MAG: hypothetical protein QOE64_1390, partial [Frankiales bacterium]|nr:hypothetical protein [Frankiales bacterium]